jgi:GntR family transcriptional regulator
MVKRSTAKAQERMVKPEYPKELQSRFEEAVVQGRYTRGDVLPLGDLAADFQAPVDQMRLVALTAHRKGLLGRSGAETGTFQVLGLPKTKFASVFTHTAQAGFKPTSLVRKVVVEPASPQVADRLRVTAGSPVYRYVRTRNVDGQPLANQTNFMPFAVCPGLEHDDVSRYSFQRLLEEKYFSVLVEMQEDHSLIPSTGQDREVLHLPLGASVLVVDRIALSATNWPLVWATIRIRPDRYRYVAALWPQAAQLLEDS